MTVTSTTPFGGIKTEVVIRKYGLLQPTNWAEDCESEMRLMDDLWNKLVYINDEYISKYISLMCQEKNFSEAKSQYDNSVAASAAVSDIASSKRRLAIIQKDVARRMADALRALETSRREEVKVRAKRVVYGGATTTRSSAHLKGLEVRRFEVVKPCIVVPVEATAGSPIRSRVAPLSRLSSMEV